MRPGILGRQAGFTLTNIIVLVAIVAVATVGWRIHERRKERAATQRVLEETAAKLAKEIAAHLEVDEAWRNTREANENSRMGCLREKRSCEGKAGLIAVKDIDGRNVVDSTMPTVGFSRNGGPCLNFSEAGSDECPFRFEVNWQPRCLGDCVAPATSNLHGTLRFRPGPELDLPLNLSRYAFTISRDSLPSEPRSCAASYAAGSRKDGSIMIRPVEGGPTMRVFCDQTSDGGGWTLVANATREGDLTKENTLSPTAHSRFPPEKVRLILGASDHQNENNVRLVIHEIDGGLRLAASSNGATDVAQFTAKVPEGDCKTVSDKPIFAMKTPADDLSITFSGAGEVTFGVRPPGARTPQGFTACMGTKPDGTSCGVGCNTLWRGFRQGLKGSLWIR